MIFNVPNLAQKESVFVLRDTRYISKVFSMKGDAKLRQVLIFSSTLFCISLPSVTDNGLFIISKQGQEDEVFWLQGRVSFTLIYQTRRLASYYLDYSLTSAGQLCETGLFA